MKRADQAGQVSLQCVPHDLIVDSKVRMNETIAHTAHQIPWYLRMTLLDFIWD